MRSLALPMTVDYEKIAAGMLEMFDEEERVVLRFGMLPAKKMEILERQLTEKFKDDFTLSQITDDTYIAILSQKAQDEGWPRRVEFSMRRLVADVVHNICLEIYKIGDLVV